MFLLFQRSDWNRSSWKSPLHSNMFLLFQKLKFKYRKLKLMLYIPICFYYFRYSTQSIKAPRPSLHSNMFLLFQGTQNGLDKTNEPLHSNMFLLFPKLIQKAVYKCLNFTFQYVSIISQIMQHRKRQNRLYIPICFYYFWTA